MTPVRGELEPAEKLAPPPAVDLTNANVQQFLEQHAVDIAVRRDEMRLRKREMEVGFAYAEKALAAQERDLDSMRREQLRGRRDRYLFLTIGLLIVAVFFTVALMMGKDEFATEALKAILYLVTGGTGGYFAGRQAQRPRRHGTTEPVRTEGRSNGEEVQRASRANGSRGARGGS
jgi:hypothetical protein